MNKILNWLKGFLPWFKLPSISITITDILEIIILAFLVYKLLLWIKNTRAWTLLKGILTIVFCVCIIYLLQMDTLIYIVNKGLSIAIITAVVVFQPELRKVLEQLGEKKFISSLLPLDNVRSVQQLFSDKTVNELVKATVEMAKVKTGALIVIEQKETLEEYERTGIKLDALLTSQLLINIFEHNTPLHDGAIVVRGDRVTAATCYLPLSDNMKLSKALGTRHRAGVGISEVTDSLTVIVSEETGYISVAYRGELQRNISGEELKERLIVLQNKSIISRKFKIWKGWTKNEE
ncbi:MAG: diadenylate cyclase CdaA [Lachnospiraceae bacterium]|nr:diadenylate cyclase CdaA [Lachnospiraceae bacterium]MDD3797260.1 diadenylate cyclase CdaA [Lachnospiraceae bacterium]